FPNHPALAFALRDIKGDEEIRSPKVLIADLGQAIVHEHVPTNIPIRASLPEETERIHQELELHDVALALHRHPVIIREIILGRRPDNPRSLQLSLRHARLRYLCHGSSPMRLCLLRPSGYCSALPGVAKGTRVVVYTVMLEAWGESIGNIVRGFIHIQDA